MRGIFLFLITSLVVVWAPAQSTPPDTTAQGSLPPVVVKVKTPPIPKRAAYYSLVLPGAGQVYNGHWWKVPFVYGALGGVAYSVHYNQSRYRRLKTALELQLQGLPHEFTGQIDSPTTLRSLRDQYDKNTQLSYIGTVVVYAIIAVEAFVDAHLQNFDIDDDLSLRLQPNLGTHPATGQFSAGVGVVIIF
ncbi:MAG: hypothetical protein H6555_06585 [Lewinellaceae bacterium]|nr:hypothetical protein [Lewinellaceae bacterium]